MLKKIKPDLAFLALVPAGLLSFMLFLHLRFGNAFAFKTALFDWSEREFTSVFTTLTRWSYDTVFHLFNFYVYFWVFLALFFIWFLIHLKARQSFVVYPSVLLFFYLSTNSLEGLPRYIGFLFPLYFSVALLASKNSLFNKILFFCSVLLLTVFTVLFVNGFFLNN